MDALAKLHRDLLEILAERSGMAVPTVSAGLQLVRHRLQRKTVSKLRRLAGCYKVMRHTMRLSVRRVARRRG